MILDCPIVYPLFAEIILKGFFLFESSKADCIKQKDRALTSLRSGVRVYGREMSKNDIKHGKRNFSHFLQKAT